MFNPYHLKCFEQFKKQLELQKTTQIFIFSFLCDTSKSFMKVFTAFIKPYEAELWK